MFVGSIEYEYRFLDQWGGAVFLDAGQAFNNTEDYTTLKKGAGTGVRWYSPVGPIRLDLAFGLDKEETAWRIHFNLGMDF
jgi:translocation and assembly module TamA